MVVLVREPGKLLSLCKRDSGSSEIWQESESWAAVCSTAQRSGTSPMTALPEALAAESPSMSERWGGEEPIG